MTGDGELALSVVIPTYNSAAWLPSTLEALAEALRQVEGPVEVVLVDDGSTDGSDELVTRIRKDYPVGIVLVRQENSGRFLARWAGIERARGEFVMLLDSRVVVAPDAVAYIMSAVASDPTPAGWNAHVHTDPRSPLVGRFWEVPTFVFWGDYLRDPRPYDLTAETFDSAPKGTGAFVAHRDVLRAAFRHAWPEGDAKLISDDTKILRWIAENGGIRLDPGFSVTYRPRTTVRGFIRHSFDRGTMFVDSYAGTSGLRSSVIVLAAIAPMILLVVLAMLFASGAWPAVVAIVAVVVALLLLPLIRATINRCPRRGQQAYVCILPVFVVPFWLGLLRGLAVHRRAFVWTSSTSPEATGRAHS